MLYEVITNETFYEGLTSLHELVNHADNLHNDNDDTPLISDKSELATFNREYTIDPFTPSILTKVTTCYLGIDGGSTSSKAVLVDDEGNLLLKVYQLSKGNPIQDTLELLGKIKANDPNNYYDIKGLGVTGYAADVLEGALKADANIIETIAHMKSAQKVFGQGVDA